MTEEPIVGKFYKTVDGRPAQYCGKNFKAYIWHIYNPNNMLIPELDFIGYEEPFKFKKEKTSKIDIEINN